ncbi:signal peptidase II [Jannaschia sp. W003]|uniref:signal peptidase II n=1 Tax=Jannaschia sp. W003 TaxID=2867012 RepID=UPI0021A7FA35|nr:signal peptidase II [Jannaschia sp. W003]UWQ21434.1 signal peptidase II [Jannaschia sp. W003]
MGKLAATALAAFGIDQLSKLFVVHLLNLREVGAMDVAPPWLRFRMGWNEGINFGLMSGAGAKWALIALALAICGAVLWWSRGFRHPLAFVSAGLVVGGALANVLDRLLYGAVADFLNMSVPGIHNPFAFNFADVFIFAGAFGLVLFADKAGDGAADAR